MEAPPAEELLCLHLDDVGGDPRSDPAPAGYTIRGICEALAIDGQHSPARVDLLATLSGLAEDGFVASRTGTVAGGGERTVYWLTDRGRERATAVRARLADETVLVEGSEAVPVDELDRHVDDGSVVRALARRTADGRVAAGDPEFVDRDAELGRFSDAVAAARNRGSRTVVVGGEAGIGKTSLVDRGLDQAREAGFAVGTATCRRDRTAPFGPLVEALRTLPGGEDAVAPIAAGDADGSGAVADERAALFDAVADGLRDLAADRPVALFIDDLQWADPATRSLFVHLAASVTAWIYPVLFVATYRVEGAAVDDRLEQAVERLAAGDRGERIELGPLPAPDRRGLVAGLTDGPSVPESFVDLVADESGGNPLVLRETVRYLRDAGDLEPAAGRYPTSREDLAVPADVETVVQGRLAPLPDAVRRVLEVAAVAGDVVEPAVLAAVLDAPVATVNDRLDLLAAGHLLEWRGDRVAFAGGVVRDALVADLPAERRRRLHGRVAEAVASAGDGDAAERHSRMAYHHEQAGDAARALSCYREAGDRAADAYAHDLAAEQYEAALDRAEALGRDAAATDLLVALGRVAYHRGEYGAAQRRLARAVDRTDDAERRMAAAYYRARVHSDRGEYEAALERAADGIDHWDGGTVTTTVVDLLTRKGWALQQTGDLEAAKAAFERALSLARELDDDEKVGQALHGVGSVELYRGETDAVVDTYRRALDVLERTDDRRRLGRAKHNLALGYRHRGEPERATETFREALEVQVDIGDEAGATVTRVNLGEMATDRGDWDAALEHLRTARASAQDLDQGRMEAVATGDLGELKLARGDLAAAGEHLRTAVERCDHLGHDRQSATWQAVYARWHHLAGDQERARDHGEAALATAEDVGLDREASIARAALGAARRAGGDVAAAVEHHRAAAAEDPAEASRLARSLLAAGRPDDAADAARRAMDATDPETDPQLAVRARAALGACLRECGDLTGAAEHLRAAAGRAGDLGLPLEECRSRRDLGLLQRARGDQAAAAATIEDALALAEEAGAGLLVERCEAALP